MAISVEQAQEEILGYIHVLGPERKPILECLGQVLAEDIHAESEIPPWDNSAMDGYAVRAVDTRGASEASPRVLSVIDEAAAGSPSQARVARGMAIRIMTGAPLPAGADAVVQFEHTDEQIRRASMEDASHIGILRPAKKGLNIRNRGEDIAVGSRVLPRGTVLRPAEIGVLASLGHSTARVVRRPVISVLATGDELVDIDVPLAPGKIHNSNTYTIAAEITRYGGIPRILGIGRDSMESLNEKIDESLSSDMLITCGGVSRGDYDMVKNVLAQRGQINFWTVHMKPGKPLAFGMIGRDRSIPHLGLPGNPVSSMVTFEQFVRPAILKMLGKENLAKPTVLAIIQRDVTNRDGRRELVRVTVTRHGREYHAVPTGPQGSGILTSMVKANGLAIIPEDTGGVKKGDVVRVQMLDWSRSL